MSRRSGSWVRCSLVTFAIVSALCVCGPALYWRFNKSVTVSDSPSSCSPCHCNCPEPVSLQISDFPIPEHSVMARLPVDSTPAPQEAAEEQHQQLKHLEFVQEAIPLALLYFSKLYNVAKDKSGPLKPGMQTVEGTIKSVVEPVYQKFQDIPVKVIKYIDDKVDESMTSLNDVVFPAVTQVTGVAHSVATEVKKAGVADTATALAKSVYTKYEPAAMELAERCAVSSWHRLKQLPVFPKVAQSVVPTATYCTEKYNQMVQLTADKGYKVASYLPLVPTEKIAKIFDPESNPAAAAAH